MYEVNSILFFGCLILALLLLTAMGYWLLSRESKPREGDYVAEVWLDWEICRGSTLYRQRFKTQLMAALYAKLAAVFLDWVLPTHFRGSDFNGKSAHYRQNFSIRFGVRKIEVLERRTFRAIWSPVMPGATGSTGEHASVHPKFSRDGEDLSNLKI